MYDIKQLAAKLNVSPRTLYDWVARREIPYYKIRQGLRFDEEEIEAWLKERRVPLKEELEEKEHVGNQQ